MRKAFPAYQNISLKESEEVEGVHTNRVFYFQYRDAWCRVVYQSPMLLLNIREIVYTIIMVNSMSSVLNTRSESGILKK